MQSGIHDRFAAALLEKMSSFKTGLGTDAATTHGPLIHQVQRDRCKAFVDDMVAKGGKVLTGGNIPAHLPKDGAFYEPTLVTGVNSSMNHWKGEIFGPVAALTKFETEKEALDMANDCEMVRAFLLLAFRAFTDILNITGSRCILLYQGPPLVHPPVKLQLTPQIGRAHV